MSSGDSPAEAHRVRRPPAATDRIVSVVPLVPAWRLDRPFAYRVPPELDAAVQPGVLVAIPLGGRNVRGIVLEQEPDRGATELQAIKRVVIPEPLTPPPLDRLYDWIARRYAVARPAALARAVPPRVRVARPEPVSRGPAPAPNRVTAYTGARELWTAVTQGRPGTWLFQTVPGEERGSLIAELAGAATTSGGTALVAVPEVAHGSRVIDELVRVFGDVARVDSAVGDAERARAWIRLASGHPLGVGGRSVVLAPTPALRLIVLDEEHHPSYKEDRSPRYDARRVARERARLQEAVCVFVGSSPSVQIGTAALQREIGWVRPSREQERAARPIVEVAELPTDRPVSTLLRDRIRRSLESGGRVALLAPSRGYARVVWCASCRRSLRCERCETPMALEYGGLHCVACGHSVEPSPISCPYCSSTKLAKLGAGSERVAEQLAASFPRARVAHVGPDTFDQLRGVPLPDVYVTTWIGTKEVLRPNVSLVGVLNADTLIRKPDWRAAEVAYQALAEMSEWAGPAEAGGRLVIQTSDARHHAVQAIARADYRFFLEREIEQRRELNYPPHKELIRVTIRGPQARALVQQVADAARVQAVTALGPMPAQRHGFDKGASNPGLEMLLKCDDAGAVAEVLRDILARVRGGNSVTVDVDPL